MKITTLIPAYKPNYLFDLLISLKNQTVKPYKIIFSDDSPNQEFEGIFSSNNFKELVENLNIEVIKGPQDGAYNNFRNLLHYYNLDASNRTELFHILLDDDILYPTFYERHIFAHLQLRATCVVSRRWTALESGQPFRDSLPLPEAIASHPNRILSLDSDLLFKHTVGEGKNWLGEFSNASFRADMVNELDQSAMVGISYKGLEDLGGILKASMAGSVGFINEHLGAFRTSPIQHSANPMGRPLKLAFLAYVALTIIGRNLGKLTDEVATQALNRIAQFITQNYGHESDMSDFCALMPGIAESQVTTELEFLQLWEDFSEACNLTPFPPLLVPQVEITILLPVYNGESYINQTIESMLAQNFTNFEVLCIDDCSTDSSIKILEYYAKLDSRIRILRMSSNQGNVPLVLNKTLNEIRGKYVVYSSQDDLFSKDWLMKMYSRAKETGADAVVPDLVFYYENEPNLCKKLIGVKGNREAILTGREATELSLDWTIPGNAMWNVNIIRRLRFADFSFNADEYSTREFYFYARKVVFCDGIFYYRQDNPDAITKKISIKNFDAVYTFIRLFEFLKEKNYSFDIYSLEALKAVRLLELLKIWFDQYKVNLSAAEIETAELSIKRNQDALIALGLLNLH